MRALILVAVCGIGCGDDGNNANPRLIAGGGVGDGSIDGKVNVHVIDTSTDEPIAGATVGIGEVEKTTDANGLAVFTDVSGPQTVAALYEGYRSAAWTDVDGANVTIPLAPLAGGAPAQATLSGTIAGWSSITLPQGHVKAAVVTYSQTDNLGDAANNLPTPNNGNICFGAQECAWSIVTRTGSVTLSAVIIDRDTKGTLDDSDDTNTIIGYAFRSGITVEAGVSQSGLMLQQIEAGNLDTVTIDLGTPPAALTETFSLVGIELGEDEVVQLPVTLFLESDSYLVPRPSVYGTDATYRLTAIAQTASGNQAAQSIILRQGLTGTALAAGTWLVPPVGVTATRSTATWTPVAGAKAHSVAWRESDGTELVEITVFDENKGSVDVPILLTLPATGTLTARVSAIGADFNVNDFSLKDDSQMLWGIAAQPTSIP